MTFQPEGSKIKFGGGATGSSQPKDDHGLQRPRIDPSEGERRVPLPAAGPGFITEADRRHQFEEQKKSQPKPPVVRPPVLIAAGLAITVLALHAFFGKHGTELPQVNVDDEVKKYSEYRKSSSDEEAAIRRELEVIVRMENAGKKEEVVAEWQKLLLWVGGDRNNPIYKLSVQHLEHVE